jgi:hypothetical protein
MAEVTLILKANNSDYVNKMKQSQTETQKVYDTATKGGKQEKGILTEIEEKLTSLQKKRKDAFSYEEIAKYNQKIQEAKMHLDEYEKAGLKTQKTTETLSSTISKWALGLGAASIVLGKLKEALLSTTAGMNAFNIVGAVTKQIFYDIVTSASISIPKIQAAIAIQRQLNDLRLKELADSREIAKAEREFQELYAKSVDQTLSKADRLIIIDKAIAEHNKSIDKKLENAKELLIATTALANLNKADEKAVAEGYRLLNEIDALEALRVSGMKRLIRTRTEIIDNEQKDQIEKFKKFDEEVDAYVEKILKEREDDRKDKHRKSVDAVIEEEERLIQELKKLKEESRKLFPETYITIFGTNAADDAVSGKTQKTYLEKLKDMAAKALRINKVIEDDNKRSAASEDDLRQQRIEALKEGLQTMQDFISKMIDREVEMAERRRELLDTQISELQNEIETEAELQKEGFANNLSAKQKELAELKKLREKALKDEEEALKKQRAMETIAQGINIFTSATQLLKTYTKIPLLGIALAAGAITAMFAILSSVKAKTAESTKLAHGGSGSDTGIITGRTHARGGERFLSQVEVERGEAWGVLSVPATQKFGKVFHHMVSSFNKGQIPMPVNNINDIRVDNSGSNSRLDQLITENKKLNEKLSSDSIQTLGNIQVIRKGNTIRKVRV